MILSASRRTDIPAYYGDWLMNRLRAGFALVPNPLNPKSVARVVLSRESVDAIAFWTRDFSPLTRYIDEIERMGYPFYVQYTLTPYGRDVESRAPDKAAAASAVADLSSRIGKNRIVWRYDPILVSGAYTADFHASAFARLADSLRDKVRGVVISFIDRYPGAKNNYGDMADGEKLEIAGRISSLAAERGLCVSACCEALDFGSLPIAKARCIDPDIIKEIVGGPVRLKKVIGQRAGCGCAASVDIGAYSTCLGGCAYCYARRSEAALHKNIAAHSADGESMIGELPLGAVVYDRIIL